MFDFITEEHKMIRAAARDFAQKSIAPIAEHHDAVGEFPLNTIRQMGQLGFMGIEVPESYGGAAMDTSTFPNPVHIAGSASRDRRTAATSAGLRIIQSSY